MNAQDERAELMAIAQELVTLLPELTKKVHLVVNKLIEHGDKLLMPAMDEKQEGIKPVAVKLVKFNAPSVAATVTSEGTPVPVGKGTGKRACGICRQPGHRSTTCPQANAKYKADRKKK